MNKFTVIALYILALVAIGGCAVKKKVSESYVSIEKDSISYALPSSNELTVTELCDTLEVKSPAVIQKQDGPVNVRIETKDNTLTVKTEYDTIYKDRIVEKQVIQTEEKETTVYRWAKITWIFLVWAVLATVWIFRKPLLRLL